MRLYNERSSVGASGLARGETERAPSLAMYDERPSEDDFGLARKRQNARPR